MAHAIGLKNHSDEDYKKALQSNIESFDSYVKRFSRTVVTERKGKAVKTEKRRPNKPVKSPLFTKGESKILQDLMTPLWETLEPFQKDWVDIIYSNGFEPVNDRISEIMKSRYLAIEAFAKATTNRLNTIKNMDEKNGKKRKSEITSEDVSRLLRSRKDLLSTTAEELSDIIPKDRLLMCVNEGLAKDSSKVSTNTEAKKLIINKLYLEYQKEGMLTETIKEMKIITLDDIQVAQIYNIVNGLFNKITNIREYVQALADPRRPQHKQNKNLIMLRTLRDSIIKDIDKLESLDKSITIFAWKQISLSKPKTRLTNVDSFNLIINSIEIYTDICNKFYIQDESGYRDKILETASGIIDSL